MGLSVTEKQELRGIISKRISARIDQLKAEHKDELAALSEQARAAAHSQLGTAAEMEALEALNERKTTLEREINAAEEGIYDRVKHLDHPLYNTRADRIKLIISRVQKPIEDSLFRATELGQRIAGLSAEQSHLDETVWVATSPKQVSEIFKALNTILDERPTALEQAAHDLLHPDE